MNKDGREGTKKNGLKIAVILFLIIFAALYVFIYVIPGVTDIFTDTYTASYGTLSVGEEIDYMVIRTEKLYTAQNSGSVSRKAEPMSVQRAGTAILKVAGTTYSSDERGIISFYYDKYESVFTPDNMLTITKDAIDQIKRNEDGEVICSECVSDVAAIGDPVFKTVDNQVWYIVAWVDNEQANNLKVGNTAYVLLEDGTKLKTSINSITLQSDMTQIIFKCNRYYEGFDKIRAGRGNLVSSEKSGIILETSSIVEIDGVQGVYVVNKLGNNVFTRINVLAGDEESTVVEKNYFYDDEGEYVATVKIYDKILRVEENESKISKKDKEAAE